MLNENAKKWVAALRSGKYKQGRCRLTSIQGGVELHCCLGVACKVAIENGVQLSQIEYTISDIIGIEYGIDRAFLPQIVMDWLKINTNKGDYGIHLSGSLTEKNDSGSTFEEIADIIESEPKGLFCE